jgi:hypothetical protein
MKNNYLRAFVIGSSAFIVLPFFYAVSNFDPAKFNYDYVSYTFLAPIGLGLMNVISLFLSIKFKLSTRMRFLLTSILAPTTILTIVKLNNIYNYTIDEWLNHIIKTYMFYFIIVNVFLYGLDKYV